MSMQETNENYYKYINTENYPIKPGVAPQDIKVGLPQGLILFELNNSMNI